MDVYQKQIHCNVCYIQMNPLVVKYPIYYATAETIKIVFNLVIKSLHSEENLLK